MRRVSLLVSVLVLALSMLPGGVSAQPPEAVVFERGGVSTTPVGVAASQVPAAEQGAVAVAVEEVVAERSERSRTWVMSDGSRAVEVAFAPLHVPDGVGGWVPIDLALADNGDGFAPGRSPVAVWLPGQATGAVSVGDGEVAVALSLLGAGLPGRAVALQARPAQARVAADRGAVRYDGVLEGVDVVYEATVAGVKETLVLHGPDSPTRFVYAVDAPGLSLGAVAGGGVGLVDAAGAARFAVAPPFMVDARGAILDPATIAMVHGAFTAVAGSVKDAVPMADLARIMHGAFNGTKGGHLSASNCHWLARLVRKWGQYVDMYVLESLRWAVSNAEGRSR